MVLKCICINPISVFQEGGVYEYQVRLTGASNLPNKMYVIFSDKDKVFYTAEVDFLKNFSKNINPIEDFRDNIKRIKEQIRRIPNG